MDNRKGLTQKNIFWIGSFTGVFLGVIGPILINESYKSTFYRVSYVTLWDAAILLQYYGTLLGATATIIAVVLTINHANKVNKENRNHSEKINQRNIGIQVSFDLIDSCEISRIDNVVSEIKLLTDERGGKVLENIAMLKIMNLATSIKEKALKFQLVYPQNDDDMYKKLNSFLEPYTSLILELALTVKESSGFIQIEDSVFLEIITLNQEKYIQFVEQLQEIISINDLKNEIGDKLAI